jgi:inosine-uridine nucleoside N-ribohydrolase
MTRKVIIDCDAGIDDAAALCLALFDPRLDVVAVTGVAGNVPAEQAGRNIQIVIDQLDPPRFPRVGTATALDDAPAMDGSLMHGDDGLGNSGYETAPLHHQHPSDKIIYDEIRAAPDEITLLCLGPLTNVALALKRDPSCTARSAASSLLVAASKPVETSLRRQNSICMAIQSARARSSVR